MNKFKITASDIFGAMVDIAFMAVRPILFWLIWNYGIAGNTNVPKLDILQVISIIVLFHLLMSYIPVRINTSEKD